MGENTNEPKSLEDAYAAYCREQGLPQQSIEELLYLDSLTDLQRGWLECAQVWWEVQCVCEMAEPSRAAGKKPVDHRVQLVRELAAHFGCGGESIEQGLKTQEGIISYAKRLESNIELYKNDWNLSSHVQTMESLVKRLKQIWKKGKGA